MFHLLVHDDLHGDWIYNGKYETRERASRVGNEFGNYMIIEGLVVEKVLLPVNEEEIDDLKGESYDYES